MNSLSYRQLGRQILGHILCWLASLKVRKFSQSSIPPGSPASSSGAFSPGQTWSGARGGPSNDARAGTPLLGGKAGRAGAAQPGEEYLKGSTGKKGRDSLSESIVTGQGAIVLKWKRVDLGQIFGINSLLWRWWDTGTSCPCRTIGSVWGQVGWDSEQPGLVKSVPAHVREDGNRWSIRCFQIQTALWFFDSMSLFYLLAASGQLDTTRIFIVIVQTQRLGI